MQGLFVKGRLVTVPRANSGIGGYLGFASGRDSTRILQFAINTVIYALTQEGAMTQRLMQIVHRAGSFYSGQTNSFSRRS